MMEMVNIGFRSLTLGVPGIFENPRLKASAAGLRELAASIETHGLMNPLQVWEYENADGEVQFVIVGGSRRYQALTLLVLRGVLDGDDLMVPCRMIDVDLVSDARSAALIDNLQREELSPYELAKEVYELRANGGMSGSDLAKKLGKSAAWVSRHYTSWRDTSPDVKALWRKGALTTDEVQQLSKLPLDDQAAHAQELVELRASPEADKADMAGRVKARKKVKEMKAARAPKRGEASDDGEDDGEDNGEDNGEDDRPVTAKRSDKLDPRTFVMDRESIDFLIGRCELDAGAHEYVRGVYDALRYVTAQMPFGSLTDTIKNMVTDGVARRSAK